MNASLEMAAHPVSRLFPPMSEDQFAALKHDIEQNGQREPVTMWRGQIIDGLHRSRACMELGRVAITREWDGEESALTAYVVSLNLHRRHLDESQRGMVAAKIAADGHAEGIAIRNARLGYKTTSLPNHVDVSGKVTTGEAAALLNVSTQTVSRAQSIRKHGVPDLVDAVERGDMPVAHAFQVSKLPPDEQLAAVAAPRRTKEPGAVLKAKRAPGERIERLVEAFENHSAMLAEVLDDLDGDNRRKDWASRLREVRTTITRFIVGCER